MFTQWKKTIAILSSAALLNMGAALAQEHNHGNAHEHGAEKNAQLSLNKDQKWATDTSLRQAMEAIRNALSAEMPAIHSRKVTTEQYHGLAQKINDQVAYMMKNCKLDPETDAMLHLVLVDIISGADAMSGQDSGKAQEGAVKVVNALNNYAAYFAHPGWTGLSHSR